MPISVHTVLQSVAEGKSLTLNQRSVLKGAMLVDSAWGLAFGVTPDTVDTIIEQRAQRLPQVYPHVALVWQQQQIATPFLELLWHLWLPLALQLIAAHQALDRPWIQGVLGMQGAGKSTLTQVLCVILNQLGYPSGTLSIDDFYKTYTDRQILRQQDPRLIWRGPPGTHDVDLAIQILDQLRAVPASEAPIQVPRFDKSAWGGQGDRKGFEPFPTAAIVFLEGWFVGLRPIASSAFGQPLPPIMTAADRQFARDMNEQLHAYVPLWERLDALLVLKLTDYQLSKRWRREAEQKAIAAGRAGMSDAEVDAFVDYFWKALHPELFITPLAADPRFAHFVIEIDASHGVAGVYRNQGSA